MEAHMKSRKSPWVSMGIFVFLIFSSLMWKAWAGDDKPQNCSLFTQKEVAEIMGKAAKPGEETALGCGWVPRGETLSYLTVFIKADSRTAKKAVGTLQAGFKVIDVSGVGDDAVAVVEKSSQEVTDMYVHKGKYLVRLNMPFLEFTATGKKFKKFRKIAQKAVNRL
jgi:hypothetical protein